MTAKEVNERLEKVYAKVFDEYLAITITVFIASVFFAVALLALAILIQT